MFVQGTPLLPTTREPMRLSILSASAFLLVLAACAADSSNGTPPNGDPSGTSPGGPNGGSEGGAGDGDDPDGGADPMTKGAPGTLDKSFADGGTLEYKDFAAIQLPPFTVRPDSSLRMSSMDGFKGGVGRLTAAGVVDSAAFVDMKTGGPRIVQIVDDGPDTTYVLATTNGQPDESSLVRRVVGGVVDNVYGDGNEQIAPPPKPTTGQWKGGIDAAVRGGKIYVLLKFSSNNPSKRAFGVARLTSTGALDTTFGPNGAVVVESASQIGDVEQIRLDASGNIYVGARGARVFRLTPNGALDTTFGTDGIASTGLSGSAGSLELDSAGRIYVSGIRQFKAAVARLDSSGTLDPSFGDGGSAVVDFPGAEGSAQGLTLLPDGGLVLAVWVASTDVGLGRFDATGALVTSFGTGGRVRLERAGDEAPRPNAIRFDPAGRVVLVSTITDRPNEHLRLIDRIWL
jgi:uncharacterized delta-60 repeat protein